MKTKVKVYSLDNLIATTSGPDEIHTTIKEENKHTQVKTMSEDKSALVLETIKSVSIGKYGELSKLILSNSKVHPSENIISALKQYSNSELETLIGKIEMLDNY